MTHQVVIEKTKIEPESNCSCTSSKTYWMDRNYLNIINKKKKEESKIQPFCIPDSRIVHHMMDFENHPIAPVGTDPNQ